MKITIISTGAKNAYLLDNGETKLQIDMGVSPKMLPESPDYVIYSHYHGDHFTSEKTYRKKYVVKDFKSKMQNERLGSFFVQSVPLRHGKECVNGFVIRDLRHEEIYIFAIDFSDYKNLATVANDYSRAYNEPITLIMCELHHSVSKLENAPEQVVWASRRHCSDELFTEFVDSFDKSKLRMAISLHTNHQLFNFHGLKCVGFSPKFPRNGAVYYL